MRLLVATRSPHKLREIRDVLAAVPGVELLDPDQAGVLFHPEEDGLEPFQTFRENAASKARYFHRLSGLPTVADDSGLEVDALDGAPGVHSKRFAPERGLDGEARDQDNNRFLIERLAGVPLAARTARYVCEAVLVIEGGGEVAFRGVASGVILEKPDGEGGFGYDPFFFDAHLGTTFACISREEKNARSHRGKAFRQLAQHLQNGGVE